MKRILSLLIFLVAHTVTLTVPCYGQGVRNAKYERYIEAYKDLAIEQMQKHGIPASITLAQGLLESGAGGSSLAVYGNNHFGIKCHGWNGRTMHKDDDARNECFRVYDTPRQSYEDHSLFLCGRPRYASLFKLSKKDYKGWAHGLKAAGYATNPQYAYSLIRIIETYDLGRFDNAKDFDKFIVKHEPRVSLESAHTIHKCNKNYYVIARDGDTFKSISKEVGVSHKKLAKYNERSAKDVLKKGDIVYLEKKRTKADKSFKNQPHVVKAGESMYTIAQRYGIRLKSLYKKNKFSPDHVVTVGEKIRLY